MSLHNNVIFTWYIAKCPSGAEETSIKLLKEALFKFKAEEYFKEYFIPYDKKEKRLGKKSIMGNYIFLQMHLNEDLKKALRQVDKISLMLDHNLTPATASEKQIELIKAKLEEQLEIENSVFQEGELVLVKKAPFEDFKGTIESVYLEKNMVKVSIPILGTQTMVDLSFDSIERIKE